MTGDYISISYGDLAFAAVLLVVNAGFSIRLGLGLERQMLIAAARMTVQLLLIGVVLKFLFALALLWVTVLAMLVMAAVAGSRSAPARSTASPAGEAMPWVR